MSEATSPSNPLKQQQLEKLEQIGIYLRETREDQGLTLDQVAANTMIRARLLRAIEDGQLDQLPESVYVQGFIKRYANALGLDGEAIGKAFPIRNDASLYPQTLRDTKPSQLRPLHLYFVYLVLIVGAIAGLSYVLQRNAGNLATSPPPPTAPSPVVPSPVASPSPEASPVSSPSAQENPLQIDVTLQDRSWMRVTVDGEIVFEGVLEQGTQRTWSGNEEIQIRAGNAGGVRVAFNQQEGKLLGDEGSVRQVTFTPDAPSPLDES